MSDEAFDLLSECWIMLPDGELRKSVEEFLFKDDGSEPKVMLCGACSEGRVEDCSGWCGVMSGKAK